jgi:hypothetical protein
MDKDRRFIEESFPVKEVSIESARGNHGDAVRI